MSTLNEMFRVLTSGSSSPSLVAMSMDAAVAMYRTVNEETVAWSDDMVAAAVADLPNVSIDSDGVVWLREP